MLRNLLRQSLNFSRIHALCILHKSAYASYASDGFFVTNPGSVVEGVDVISKNASVKFIVFVRECRVDPFGRRSELASEAAFAINAFREDLSVGG